MSVGLDIGFHSLKVVELAPSSDGFKILNFAVKEIPQAVLKQKDRAGASSRMPERNCTGIINPFIKYQMTSV